MTQSALLTVAEWQKKSSEVASKNKDRLISAVSKGFDAMAAVLSKDSAPVDIHSALAYLSVERSVALKFDDAKDESLRDLVYGLLESMHVSLNEWNEERKQRNETGEISTQTEENPFLSLLEHTSHEAYLPIGNNAPNDISAIQHPPPSFPIEPKEENIDSYEQLPHDYQISASEVMRDVKFMENEMDNDNKEGIIPNSQLIFPNSLDLIDQILPRDFMGEEPKLEDVENSEMGDGVNNSFNEPPFNEDQSAFRTNDGEESGSLVNDMIDNEGEEEEAEEEEVDQPSTILRMADVRELAVVEMDSFEMSDMEHADGIDQSEFGGNVYLDSMSDLVEREEVMDNTPVVTEDSSADGDIELRTNGRLSRRTSKSVKYMDSLESSDGDEAPPVKKSRTKDEKKREKKSKADQTINSTSKASSQSESTKRRQYVPKINDTELECPQCEFRTRSVKGWEEHLRRKHSTTPRLEGLALRCDCGVECLSEKHVRQCDIANVTVICKSDVMKEPKMAKLNDTELKCPECEYRGRSVKAWDEHLRRNHSITPTMAGLALRCDCGHEGFSDKHSRTCESTNTTVIPKSDMKKKVTPQCVICEAYPKTVSGYAEHLHRYHQTTLKASGIYLMCTCAFKVTSSHCLTKHKKECDGCHFTLHNLNEE